MHIYIHVCIIENVTLPGVLGFVVAYDAPDGLSFMTSPNTLHCLVLVTDAGKVKDTFY